MNVNAPAAPLAVESLSVITYLQQPVVTTELLAQLYGTEANNITKNFCVNSDRFVAGKHFFKLEGEALREFKHYITKSNVVEIPRQTRHFILWTERGAARHAKMLDTEQAWEVFEKLEDCYFSVKPPVVESAQPALPSDELTKEQHAILRRLMILRFPYVHDNSPTARLVQDRFQCQRLSEIPASRFLEACTFILNLPSNRPRVKRPSPAAALPAPAAGLPSTAFFNTPKGQASRWLLVVDVHGALYGNRLADNSFIFDPATLPEIIREPAGLVSKSLLPAIATACIERMR